MDGMAAVSARIHEIRSLIGVRPPVAPAAQSSSAFARTLAEATATAAPAAATPAVGTPAAPASTPSYAALGLGSSVARPPGLAVPRAGSAVAATGGPVAATGGPVAATGGPASAAALPAYGNGRIPAEALTPIGRGNHRLAAPAAAAFRELEAAAKRDGVTFGVTDSYRSYEAQVDLVKRKGLYSQGGLAARPGTSDHGWGKALDLDLDPKAQAWMRANGGKYGWVENVPREPWHWAFQP
jgi:D-alanyl-D-alanine carboxypeptidase